MNYIDNLPVKQKYKFQLKLYQDSPLKIRLISLYQKCEI